MPPYHCLIGDDTALAKGAASFILLGGNTSGQRPEPPAYHLATPFHLQQLLELVSAIRAHPLIKFCGSYILDQAARSVRHTEDPQELILTGQETSLLACLAEQAEQRIDRETLLEGAWGYRAKVETNTLETHIWRLRTKLSAAFPKLDIVAQDGGYRLCRSDTDSLA